MGKTAINIIVLFFILILSQVVICNNICLFNVAVPFVFIYFIVRLPLTMNINIVLTISFLTGLTIDMFSDTQGMHALACTILAFIRKYILRLYIPREEEISDALFREVAEHYQFKIKKTAKIKSIRRNFSC